MERVDEAILHAVAGIRTFWLSRAMTDITSLGSMTLISLITATAFALLWVIANDRNGAARIVTAAAGAEFLVEIFKRIVARPRPEILPHLVEITGFSLPSGHAMVSAATYGTLSAIACGYVQKQKARRTIQIVCWTVAVLIAISRVYLGVHYPSDVVAGFLVGIAWSYGAERLWRTTPASQRE